MSTAIDLQTDRDEIYRALRENRRPDPEVARRVHERAEKIREDIRRRHGVLNVVVDLVREGRNEG